MKNLKEFCEYKKIDYDDLIDFIENNRSVLNMEIKINIDNCIPNIHIDCPKTGMYISNPVPVERFEEFSKNIEIAIYQYYQSALSIFLTSIYSEITHIPLFNIKRSHEFNQKYEELVDQYLIFPPIDLNDDDKKALDRGIKNLIKSFGGGDMKITIP